MKRLLLSTLEVSHRLEEYHGTSKLYECVSMVEGTSLLDTGTYTFIQDAPIFHIPPTRMHVRFKRVIFYVLSPSIIKW